MERVINLISANATGGHVVIEYVLCHGRVGAEKGKTFMVNEGCT